MNQKDPPIKNPSPATPLPKPKPAAASKRGWQAIACDLDGTLLGRDHKTDPRDRDALHRARDAGLHVALCTGRNTLECAGHIAAMDLSGLGIFVNGAVVANMADGLSTRQLTMDPLIVDELVDFFGQRGHAVLVLVDHPLTRLPVYIRTQHGQPHRATVEWMLANRMHALVQDVLAPEFREHIVRLSIVADVPEAIPLERELAERFGERIFHYSLYAAVYDCQVIETFHPRATKWSGIETMCRELGIDPQHVVAIGDDLNDLPMLTQAKLSFAMGNGNATVQKAAKQITLRQSEAGVAHVIDGILEGRW